MDSHTPDTDSVADALHAYLHTIEQIVTENITDDDIEVRLRKVAATAALRRPERVTGRRHTPTPPSSGPRW